MRGEEGLRRSEEVNTAGWADEMLARRYDAHPDPRGLLMAAAGRAGGRCMRRAGSRFVALVSLCRCSSLVPLGSLSLWRALSLSLMFCR